LIHTLRRGSKTGAGSQNWLRHSQRTEFFALPILGTVQTS